LAGKFVLLSKPAANEQTAHTGTYLTAARPLWDGEDHTHQTGAFAA